MDSPNIKIVPSRTIHSLLKGIIDYAGLFPPATLPLEEAVEKYTLHKVSEQAWMLARFVIPVARLGDLDARTVPSDPRTPLRLAVLPTGGDDPDDFLAALAPDALAIRDFLEEHGPTTRVDQFEMRPPRSILDTDVITLRHFLDKIYSRLEDQGLHGADVFCEIPFDTFLHQTLPVLCGALAAFNRDHSDPDIGHFGLKIRTGGKSADDFPSVPDVAFVIASCRDSGVRFKATAGLHDPLFHFDEKLATHVHGFLNVFGAAVLAGVHHLGEEELRAVLAEKDPAKLEFDDQEFRWQQFTATAEQIAHLRTDLARSFGSCSFEEPVDGLKNIGLLPA